jgi:hypothetical protein
MNPEGAGGENGAGIDRCEAHGLVELGDPIHGPREPFTVAFPVPTSARLEFWEVDREEPGFVPDLWPELNHLVELRVSVSTATRPAHHPRDLAFGLPN